MGGNPNGLNAVQVTRRNKTIFIPLPRHLWRTAGRCSCPYCGGRESHWDTLAVATTTKKGNPDVTWMVHAPELHGAQPLPPEKHLCPVTAASGARCCRLTGHQPAEQHTFVIS